ncbi:hypothetical protein QPL79_05400 [Ignisphaera sp. 4213-co]|uniref:VapB-type antitoxin n=1 Tax=Ignisphaera cupida TaxID=3050454 RepID=A0ABD4Z9M3_9CREN|nr:hypothetical protein [Ignisphaera sp. 4213-co]MDK6028793.1 hypothetical protein [Ignisphaera sp. 4213-co]
MKLFREVNWSEVVRKAIEEYIRRLEEGEKIVPAEALMEEIMRMGVSPSDLEPMSGELRNIYIDPLGRRSGGE